MRVHSLLLAALSVFAAQVTYAADTREAVLPARVGVAVEPAHRDQVVSIEKRSFRLDPTKAFWVVSEPQRLRALLPADERAIAAEEEAEQAARSADQIDSLQFGRSRAMALAPKGPAATVYFGFNSVVPEDGVPLAYLLGKTLNRPVSFRVVGHTDGVGGEEFNMRLSVRRAESVAGILVGQGVEAGDVVSFGRGLTEPAGTDAAKNRRVEVFVAPRSRLEGGK